MVLLDHHQARTHRPTPFRGRITHRPDDLFRRARYIDDLIARRRSTAFDGSSEEPSVEWEEAGPQWYLTDAQFSVVALLDATGDHVLERVRYDPYGNAQHIPAADYDGGGYENWADLTGMSGAYGSAALMGDFNRSGNVSIDDWAAYLDAYYWTVPETPYGSGWISHPDFANGGSDSIVGDCGYIHNHETAEYTGRFRHYAPTLGRWLERDPAGYMDGLGLYEYAQGTPSLFADPHGLVSGTVHHVYPIGLGGASDGPCVDLKNEQLHNEAHRQINSDLEDHAERKGLTRHPQEKPNDFQRRVWSEMTERERSATLKRALKAGGVDSKSIKKFVDEACSEAGNDPGVKQGRCTPKKVYSWTGKTIKGLGVALIGVTALGGSREAGAHIIDDSHCAAVKRAVGKILKDGECGHLQDVKNDVDQCLTGLGVSLENVIDGNKAGLTTAAGTLTWDKIVDECNSRKNENRCSGCGTQE